MATQDDYIRTALRVPPELHAQIHASAKANNRTFNAEIVAILERSLGSSSLASVGFIHSPETPPSKELEDALDKHNFRQRFKGCVIERDALRNDISRLTYEIEQAQDMPDGITKQVQLALLRTEVAKVIHQAHKADQDLLAMYSEMDMRKMWLAMSFDEHDFYGVVDLPQKPQGDWPPEWAVKPTIEK